MPSNFDETVVCPLLPGVGAIPALGKRSLLRNSAADVHVLKRRLPSTMLVCVAFLISVASVLSFAQSPANAPLSEAESVLKRQQYEQDMRRIAIIVRDFVEQGDFSISAINTHFDTELQSGILTPGSDTPKDRGVSKNPLFHSQEGCSLHFSKPIFYFWHVSRYRLNSEPPNIGVESYVRAAPSDAVANEVFVSPNWERRVVRVNHEAYSKVFVHLKHKLEVQVHAYDGCPSISIRPEPPTRFPNN